MADQPIPTTNPVTSALTVLDHGLAAQERALLNMGIPLEFLARVLMQHSASILSLVEPAVVRADMMKTLIGNYSTMVRQAKLAAITTPGGVILPHAKPDVLTEIDAPSP